MAFVTREQRHGRQVWRIYWQDATRGASKAGRRKVDCEGGDHDEAMDAADLTGREREALAAGATTAPLRKRLVEIYQRLELLKLREAARLGGRQARFETPLAEFVDDYFAVLAYRAARTAGERVPRPERAPWWRPAFVERPLAARTLADIRQTLAPFREEIVTRGTMTGDVSPSTFTRYLGSFLDRGTKPRSYNKARTYLKTMFAGLTGDAASSLFRRDPRDLFRDEIEPLPEASPEIEVYSVEAVQGFLSAAERAADPGRTVEVRRKRRGRVEVFQQGIAPEPSPVLETALVLLCTGTRRGEALALRWRDVDLDRGILTVRASKTSSVRYVPITGDPAGDVAPRFLELLRAWREADPARETVIPANGADGPAWTKAWDRVQRASGLEGFTPQGCRRTFESALAAIGFASTLSSFWLGHSPQVAHRHYLAFAPGRLPGRTVEAVLGLVPFLERALERARAGKAFRLVGEATA